MSDKFYFIEKNNFSDKDGKEYFTIRIYVEEIQRSVLVFVSKDVFVNYASTKFNDMISSNKVTKESRINKYNQIVTSYNLIN